MTLTVAELVPAVHLSEIAVFRPLTRAAKKNDYNGTMKLSPAWLAVFFAICAFGQATAQVGETAGAATANRIAGLSQAFERAKGMDLDRVAAEIHRAIDEHISMAVSPKAFDPKAVQERLRRLLGAAANGGPYAFAVGSRIDRHLVIAYAVQKGTLMGPGATSATVRAYAPSEGRFAFVGTTGDDMDGYGSLNVAELHSPVSSELWLLIWGRMTGANGPNIRMRIYAYDRAKFRPIWMPENAWGAFTVQSTERGFTIDGPYYREDRVRHDGYFLAADGIYRETP